jgi:hypothetical protein
MRTRLMQYTGYHGQLLQKQDLQLAQSFSKIKRDRRFSSGYDCQDWLMKTCNVRGIRWHTDGKASLRRGEHTPGRFFWWESVPAGSLKAIWHSDALGQSDRKQTASILRLLWVSSESLVDLSSQGEKSLKTSILFELATTEFINLRPNTYATDKESDLLEKKILSQLRIPVLQDQIGHLMSLSELLHKVSCVDYGIHTCKELPLADWNLRLANSAFRPSAKQDAKKSRAVMTCLNAPRTKYQILSQNLHYPSLCMGDQ